MQSVQGLTPNYVFVIPSFLKTRGHVGDRITGEKIHGFILKCSFEFDSFVSSSLIVMYSKCEKVEDARKVFDGMTVKDTVTLNAVVARYLMGLKPNVVTWNSLISGFLQKGDQGMVFEIFRLMIADGVEPDVKFRNKEAFDTFKQMLSHGCCPTSATISTLLPACATAARVRGDIYGRSALVDLYAKCGFISEARNLFSRMPEKNTEAIELFNQMEKERAAKLDHLTFTAALTACSHVGDIELGQKLFKIMQEKYNLLGRAGKLDEAYCMIKTMPILNLIYLNHGHVELAEVAAMHLMELEPESVANRLLLSSLYSDAGKRGKFERVKKRIKKGKLRKHQGLSWIENL
ncbi:hypothetical protein AAZX31_12G057500 [Glycine max]